MHRRRIHILFIVPAVFTVLVLAAHGYVLQGAHILDLYVQQLGRTGDFYISQKLILPDTENADESVEFYQNLNYKHPDNYRSEILAKDREWIYVRSKGRSVTVVDGRIFNSGDTIFDRYTDLLFGRSRETLQQTLSDFGVDVSISSLGRFKDSIVYVIGAKYPDETRPQIWFDRSSFRPVRWFQPSPHFTENSEFMEILFSDWQSKNGTWYPMHIEFKVNTFKVRDIFVNEIKSDMHFPDEQFDVDYIRSVYPASTEGMGLPDDRSDGLSDLKKIIDNFKRIYR